MNGLSSQPKFAAFSLLNDAPFERNTDGVLVNLKPLRNGNTIEFEEESKVFPLVVNTNDVADRTSYARSLSSATSDVEARVKPEFRHGMENRNINKIFIHLI